MAHEIKQILIKDKFEHNNDQQQSEKNVCKSILEPNSLLQDKVSLSLLDQDLLNLKQNSSTTNTNMIASTQYSLPQAQLTSLMKNSSGSKFSFNSSGAPMSAITSSVTKASTIIKSPQTTSGTKMGSRRIFTPQFKLQVLESYRNDNDCKGNQRATARKYGIHRRQIQKWLQCENNLRSIIANNPQNVRNNQMKLIQKGAAPILSSTTSSRQRGVVNTDKNVGTYSCFSLANVKKFKTSNNVESLSTKSLSSTPLSFSEFISKSSSNNTATVVETSKNEVSSNIFCYDNDLHVTNIYSGIVDDHPIDLSCNQTKIKNENVARPIPIHPSLSHYKIPFYNYGTDYLSNKTSLHFHYQTMTSPQLTDISNSILKTELVDPIDLSTTNISQKRKYMTDNNMEDNNKPPKLFRPYLECNFDSEKIENFKQDESQKFPMIWSNNNAHSEHAQSDYHPFLMSYSQPINYQVDSQSFPQFTSSTPPPSISSPNDSGILINSNYHILLPLSQASPVSGYDSSTSSIYSFNDNEVDLIQKNSLTYISSHYDASSPSFSSATISPTATETKVPLSPSLLHDLKFKLHTLDCYYNDADCKRNEKLVAKKLNINCKIVEKWLRQESHLRKQYHLQILV